MVLSFIYSLIIIGSRPQFKIGDITICIGGIIIMKCRWPARPIIVIVKCLIQYTFLHFEENPLVINLKSAHRQIQPGYGDLIIEPNICHQFLQYFIP